MSSGTVRVVVQGKYAYCAALGGLSVVDISDPANPQLAGACDSPREAWDVAISGHYACVANCARQGPMTPA